MVRADLSSECGHHWRRCRWLLGTLYPRCDSDQPKVPHNPQRGSPRMTPTPTLQGWDLQFTEAKPRVRQGGPPPSHRLHRQSSSGSPPFPSIPHFLFKASE